jgi:multicomponent Na+:H+ antiporter subunit B
MAWELELALYGLLIAAAIVALEVRDLLAAAAALSSYSFFAAVLLALMGAVDVAFTEVALGAGITTVLLVTGIFAMQRRSVD